MNPNFKYKLHASYDARIISDRRHQQDCSISTLEFTLVFGILFCRCIFRLHLHLQYVSVYDSKLGTDHFMCFGAQVCGHNFNWNVHIWWCSANILLPSGAMYQFYGRMYVHSC